MATRKEGPAVDHDKDQRGREPLAIAAWKSWMDLQAANERVGPDVSPRFLL